MASTRGTSVVHLSQSAADEKHEDDVEAAPGADAPANGHDVATTVADVSITEEPKPVDPLKPEFGPPHMSHVQAFLLFLRFGCLAVGGPVAQIALMKDELVVQDKWMSPADFNKVFAVYQALPGPEATELACLFGMMATKTRFGGLLGGVGFCLPGFCLVLLFAWLYIKFDLFNNKGFESSFRCVRPCIPAMAIRAVVKISEHALIDHGSGSPDFSPMLLVCAFLGFLLTLYITPFFVTLAFAGVCHVLYKNIHRGAKWLAGFAVLVGITANTIYIGFQGLPSKVGLAAGTNIPNNTDGALFVTGFLAGLTTFGGAFTAVPYVLNSLVVVNKLLTSKQFLDGIAIVNLVPTPLVMFVTWDGFIAGGITGAILMTLGMFLPCFTFVLGGHNLFMYLCMNAQFNAFLEGVSAAVIGLISQTACTLTFDAIHNGMDALVFFCAMMVLQTSKSRNASVAIIIGAAMAGQVLYINNANVGSS